MNARTGSPAKAPGPAPPPAQPTPKSARDPRPRLRWLDVAGAALLVLAAAFVVSSDITGPLRLAATLPVLLFAPGYLLLQAVVVPPARGASLLRQALACLGISPAVVGLLALATAIVAGGFTAGAIVATVTVGSLAFAAIALQRRRHHANAPARNAKAAKAPAPSPHRPGAAPALAAPPEAARAKTGTVRP